jgi:hypothetical protein
MIGIIACLAIKSYLTRIPNGFGSHKSSFLTRDIVKEVAIVAVTLWFHIEKMRRCNDLGKSASHIYTIIPK